MKNDEGFGGFPFLDHTLIPSRFVLKDMYELTAWEIRVLLYFFYNLYSAIPCRFIDEATVLEKFVSATQDLSDTQKATQNIIRVTLASLVKNGYLRASKKTGSDGKEMMFYSLKLDLRSRAAMYTEISGSDRLDARAREAASVNKSPAHIEFFEDDDIKSGLMSSLKEVAGNSLDRTNLPAAPQISQVVYSTPKDTSSRTAAAGKTSQATEGFSTVLPDVKPPSPPTTEGKKENTTSGSFLTDLEEEIDGLKVKKIEVKGPAAADKEIGREASFAQKDTAKPVTGGTPATASTPGTITDSGAVEIKTAESEEKKKPKIPISQKPVRNPEEQRGAEIWEQVLNQMHVLLDNMTFNTWLKPSEYYKYEKGIHLIRVESKKFYEKFIKQWGNLLQEVIILIDPDFKYEFYSE